MHSIIWSVAVYAFGVWVGAGAPLGGQEPDAYQCVAGMTRTAHGWIESAQHEPVSDQRLETTVQDPQHPQEPWICTTFRRPDESYPAFIKRHKDTVDAVREVLGGRP